jgi:hypothetical protein|tara:strand:+ start:212 stop:589 length:378 start_codon:yes stop_codon:yes gene_type:complete
MTIKLLLLKSGEDIIADVENMTYGEGDEKRVMGYYLNRPCVVKLRDPRLSKEEEKSGFEVSLFPWMPLSADLDIPIPSDWVVTMVTPAAKLEKMYVEDIVNYEGPGKQDDQDSGTDEQSDSDQSD